MIWPSKLLLIYVVALSSVALHTSIGTGNLDRLSGWYTPLDVCLLWDHTTNKVTSDIQRCKKAHPYHAKQPDRCIVGNTWPTKAISCSSLNAIQYFQLSVDLNDPLLLPLQKLFGALSQKKCAFLLIGDSLMAQFFNAIMCELTREGLWTTHPTLTKTNMSKSHFVTSNLSNPPVPVKFIQLYHFAKGLHDRTSDPSMVTLKRGVDEFTRSHNCVFIVINFGAHYSDGLPLQSPVDYVEHMSRVLVYLHAVCEVRPSVRVYWRETAAQHFPTPHGSWSLTRKPVKSGCAPIHNMTSVNWRNEAIADIIRGRRLSSLRILPFFNMTLPLWDLHAGDRGDCTHFCWSPLLYQPTFHFLAAEAEALK